MALKVKSTTEVKSENLRTRIKPSEVVAFCSSVPEEAELDPIMGDIGSQRDPWPIMVGMRATWEEER